MDRMPTRELLEYLHALEIESVPASAISAAQNCVLDTLGCALFGSPEPWSRIMAVEMLAEGSKGNSTIVGTAGSVAAPAAALCNGTAAHGFELDDHLDEAIVHPGAIIVSAGACCRGSRRGDRCERAPRCHRRLRVRKSSRTCHGRSTFAARMAQDLGRRSRRRCRRRGESDEPLRGSDAMRGRSCVCNVLGHQSLRGG